MEKDCETYMEKISAYEEKIINGLIVQVYYYFMSFEAIGKNDKEILSIAQEYGGFAAGKYIDFHCAQVMQEIREWCTIGETLISSFSISKMRHHSSRGYRNP